MTVFSWFGGTWEWPAWPALITIRILVGTQADFADLSHTAKAAMVVLLIVINSACWAGAAWLVWWTAQRLTARRRPTGAP